MGEVAPHPLRRGKTPPPTHAPHSGPSLAGRLRSMGGGGVTHYASPGKPDEARVPGRGLFAGAARHTSLPASENAARRIPFAGLPLEEPGSFIARSTCGAALSQRLPEGAVYPMRDT